MMEFEEEHEEEEEEEDDEEMAVTPTFKSSGGGGDKKPGTPAACRYRECLKNHAVGIGGHAVDGCGEFMPAGPGGSLDALKCAACNCHRNFHRKELLPPPPPAADSHNHQLALYSPRHFHPPQVYNFYPYTRTTPGTGTGTGSGPGPAGYLHVSTPQQQQQRPLALPSPAAAGGEHEREMGITTMTSSSGKKRFRTKFTQEQKDKMLGLAERLGWRIQKEDEEVVQNFCQETGVKRHVLKVWMHNNKHTLGKKP